VTLGAGNNNIFIGHQGAGDESQTIRIGTAQAQTFIAGIGTTPVSGAIVMVDSGTGQLGIGPPSSARYKQDIETMGHRSTGVRQLRPVTFAYRGDAAGTAHYGLVAEEVAAVYPELVVRSSTGEVQTVKYLELIPMLLNELQRQRQEFQRTLQRQRQESAEVAKLRLELAEFRALVGSRAGEATGRLGAGAGVGRGGGGANSGTGAAERAAERERMYQVTAPTSSASRNQRRRRRGGLSFAMGRG